MAGKGDFSVARESERSDVSSITCYQSITRQVYRAVQEPSCSRGAAGVCGVGELTTGQNRELRLHH